MKVMPSGICCGCSACFSVCPKNAITMLQNSAGFYFPKIDEGLCIKCGKCANVCPEHNNQWQRKNTDLKCFASANKNNKVRTQSSSGGVFYELAKVVLENGGHVYGCSWDSPTHVKHSMIDRMEQLPRLMKSKYVQSEVGNTFREVKKDLLAGIEVLFSGTPCQNAGLLNYLGKSYQNLLTVEFICHGTPSQGMLAKFVEEYEQKNGVKITAVDFRAKETGWEPLTLRLTFDDDSVIFEKASENSYYRAFLLNLSLNESCSQCQFNSIPRTADITLGDFWEINFQEDEFQDNKGVSCVLINSNKGEKYYERVLSSFAWRRVELTDVKKGNPYIDGHCTAHRNAKQFAETVKKIGFSQSVELLLKPTKTEVAIEIAQYKWRQLMKKLKFE